MDPPMSLPALEYPRPAASAAAVPPEEPPGVRFRSHGLFVVLVNRVVSLPVGELDGNVGGANQDRACPQEPLDNLRVSWGFRITQRGDSPRARVARHPEALLHVNRNTVKHSERFAAGLSVISFPGLSKSLLSQLVGERIELRIVAVDSLERPSSQLDGGHAPVADCFGGLQRRSKLSSGRAADLEASVAVAGASAGCVHAEPA